VKINLDVSYHPQLVLNQASFTSIDGPRHFHELEHWSLSFIKDQGDLDNEHSYKLAIRYYHGDPDESPHHFHMYEMDSGNHIELITGEEFTERVDAIRQHEGDDEADKWVTEQYGSYAQVRIITQWEFALYETLKRRWLALCELISPHVNL
jgi:hypothetical protein